MSGPTRAISDQTPSGRPESLTQILTERHLARELHDGIAHQILVGLNDLDLYALYRTRHADRADAKLDHARHYLREALERVRSLAAELAGDHWPAAGDRAFGPPDPVPDRAARRELAVVLAEALRNALLHSGASTINITVDTTQDAISATVADDGCGFDVHREITVGRGMGLTSMTERVELAGGAISVDSEPSSHTSITISLPRQPPGDCAARESAQP